MKQPQPRQFLLPFRVAMTSAVIAGLVAIIAVGGAFSAGAATRTVETSATLEMEFWVSLANSSAFVSTRQEGHEWITHDFRVPLREYPGISTLLVSEPVSFSVPVTFEVEVAEPVPTPQAAASPHLPPGEAPLGRATCCRVRGMSDARPAQRAITAVMRKVIAYASTNLGLTHEGPITINIAHTVGGLNVRYEEAFGEALDELPSECSFQREGHMFFGPACRSDGTVIAREWFIRAVNAPYVSARWVGMATFEYYWAWYQQGRPPTVRDDRYRSAIFHEPATDFREGRAHEDLMAAAMLYAIESYGTFEDWRAFYEDLLDGAEVHAAFEAAFGVSLVQFYADFEEWAEQQKTILLAVAYWSCQEAARYVTPRPFAEGGGFADFHVPLALDHDGDGYVCEQYAAFRQEELSCLVVGEASAEEEAE